MFKKIWENTWRDKHGRVVIWQWPNPPLYAWIGFKILSVILNGRPSEIFSWAASGALIIWAGMELFWGVNYFRRLLGLIILTLTILSLARSL